MKKKCPFCGLPLYDRSICPICEKGAGAPICAHPSEAADRRDPAAHEARTVLAVLAVLLPPLGIVLGVGAMQRKEVERGLIYLIATITFWAAVGCFALLRHL